jgi:hypothetical protein
MLQRVWLDNNNNLIHLICLEWGYLNTSLVIATPSLDYLNTSLRLEQHPQSEKVAREMLTVLATS